MYIGTYVVSDDPTGEVLLRPRPMYALGSAVTGAVGAYTRGLAVDMAPIRVNSVCPGAVKTEVRFRKKVSALVR